MIEGSRIAVLLTCYNRKNKTVNALRSLFDSIDFYEKKYNKLQVTVYLTNDGCTDGTPEEVEKQFIEKNVNIINADGNAYWAGGMRLAWVEALKSGNFDFFLLVNDDTILLPDSLCMLLSTDEYSLCTFGKRGVYTAFVGSSTDKKAITYGAKIYKESVLKGAVDIYPTGIPQLCNMPNANILLVSMEAVNKIGILDAVFTHGAADWDYGMRARNAEIPVLTTPDVCGICDNDHDNGAAEKVKVLDMSISERKQFILRPTYYYSDSLKFFRRYSKIKYYVSKAAYYFFVYTPRLYYFIYEHRGH